MLNLLGEFLLLKVIFFEDVAGKLKSVFGAAANIGDRCDFFDGDITGGGHRFDRKRFATQIFFGLFHAQDGGTDGSVGDSDIGDFFAIEFDPDRGGKG